MTEYIERAAVEKFIEDGLNNPDKNKAFGHDAIEIMAEIHYMPAADVAPVRHGRWIGEPVDIGGHTAMECSACHKVRVVDDYCSACGAKMSGEEAGHDRHSSDPV